MVIPAFHMRQWGKDPMAGCVCRGSLSGMEAISGSGDQSDSFLIPEDTLQSLLGMSGAELSLETLTVADENGWTAMPTPDGHWLFKRKVS